MHIEVMGYILIPLGIYYLNSNKLLYLTVFFLPFTGMAIININNEFGIQPAHFFLLLLLIQTLLFNPHSIKLGKVNFKYLFLICFIILLFILSLADSILSNGNIQLSNLGQFVYFGFSFILFFLVISRVYSEEILEKIIKTYTISIFSTLIIACIQFIANKLNLFEYPYWIFNNNVSFKQLYNQSLGGFPRLSSSFAEPSMYAAFLLLVLPIIYYKAYKEIDKTYMDKWLFYLLLVILILTTSTTAFVGLLIYVSLYCFMIVKNGKLNRKHLISAFIGVSMLPILMRTSLLESVFVNIIDKFSGDNLSGSERWGNFYLGIDNFIQNPIFGAGLGSIRTTDAISNTIGNLGLFGFAVFIIFFLSILLRKYTAIRKYLSYGVLVYLLISAISNPELTDLNLWLIFALLSVRYKHTNSEEIRSN